MEFAMGSNGGGGAPGDDHNDASNARNKGKQKACHRHTNRQIQLLEKFFKNCPHPDENQRRQLSRELGLELKQIKFWFQNKRTQAKAQNERQDNSVLRAENERIRCENLAIKEALKNVICPSCGGPPFGEQEREHSLQKLKQDNAQLKEEHEKVSNLLARYIGKPISQIDSLTSTRGTSRRSSSPTDVPSQEIENPTVNKEQNPRSNNNKFLYTLRALPETEKALMTETAASAMDELLKLLRVDEPLWTKSSSDGRCIIDRIGYEKLYPRASHFKSPNARIESSKDSGIVSVNGTKLVDMFLDPNKWMDIFPTIVTKAKTIQVFEAGVTGNRNGALQMMYEQMHILSPLVPPREFYFLRSCQQLEPGQWVIADVSYDYMKVNNSRTRAWRLPSGCMIEDMPGGCSNVTWVEHVEVDDRSQTHRLYRDLICGCSAYGAERWITTLQRLCEKLVLLTKEVSLPPELGGGGVVTSPAGKRTIVKLGHRMVKLFCGSLGMTGRLDFPQLCEVNNSGVRVAIRRNSEPSQPVGTVVSAATSLWLPLSPQNVFDFFKDEKSRNQWDILSYGIPVHEIAHISNGKNPGNFISIIRPYVPSENNMAMLQESFTDSSGSMVVYAPVDIPAMNIAIAGEDSAFIPILPSGFVISTDGRIDIEGTSSAPTAGSRRSGGSLLTIAFQILVSGPDASTSKEVNMESVATINILISTTVQKIRAALNCSNLE